MNVALLALHVDLIKALLALKPMSLKEATDALVVVAQLREKDWDLATELQYWAHTTARRCLAMVRDVRQAIGKRPNNPPQWARAFRDSHETHGNKTPGSQKTPDSDDKTIAQISHETHGSKTPGSEMTHVHGSDSEETNGTDFGQAHPLHAADGAPRTRSRTCRHPWTAGPSTPALHSAEAEGIPSAEGGVLPPDHKYMNEHMPPLCGCQKNHPLVNKPSMWNKSNVVPHMTPEIQILPTAAPVPP